jgi:hypothetical protein
MTEWIVIPNWDRFQHYRDRNPAWIKVYTELLDDTDYLDLTETQRAVLHGLWLMYAKSHRIVPTNTSKLSRRLNLRVTKRTLNALSDAGFIEVSASKPLARPEHLASPEGEREKEKDTPPTPSHRRERGKSKNLNGQKRRQATAWIDHTHHELHDVDLEQVIADEFNIEDPELLADLVAYASEMRRTT